MSALTTHGGRIDAAALRFPSAPTPWLDLSTGINPRAYPLGAVPPADLCALPSPARLAELEAAAAQAFGMRAGSVAALPGSEIGLRLLASLELPGPIRVVTPSYATHAAALPYAQPLALDDLGACDWAGHWGSVLLANPNNPDGRFVAPAHLLDLARASRGWLVVDEAFADAVPDASVLPHLAADDRVLVFRSFGKFYGLAGVRLGFVCGAETMVAHFRDALGSWPVSSAAIELGIVAYRDRAWQAATRSDLAVRATALDAVLQRHGLEPRGACPLFRLIETERAAALFERLGGAGILTRPFDYAPDWLRMGVPADSEALMRLDRALADA